MGFTDYLIAAPFVVFFFGFCIFIHEFGHFIAAKWRGLHIIAFSIGFKKVWGFKHKGIEYRIGCIPCGGYVDLPQIDATGEPHDENGNPLPRAKPIDKIITAFAGPLFNILFGIVLGVIVWQGGVPEDTPKMKTIEVKTVEKYSPEYEAGLRPGDRIIAVNGEPFNSTWMEFVSEIFFTVGTVTLDVERGPEKLKITYMPKPNERRTPREKIAYPFFTPVIPLECSVLPGSPVDKAGLKTGDIILKVDGKEVIGFSEFDDILRVNRGEPFSFTVNRDGKIITLNNVKPIVYNTGHRQVGIVLSPVLVAEVAADSSDAAAERFMKGDRILKVGGRVVGSHKTISLAIDEADGKPLEFIVRRGDKNISISKVFPINPDEDIKDKSSLLNIVYSYDESSVWAARVLPGNPAAKAGIKDFDILKKVDGKEISSMEMFIDTVSSTAAPSLSLELERGGKLLTLNVSPEPSYVMDLGLQMLWIAHPTPWAQFVRVIDMTYKSLRGIFSKESTLKPRHLSGPIGIFRALAVTYRHGGIMKALSLLVMITYSLALLNLMPLPVLDGGHIVLALVESARGGKPLPAKLIQPVFIVFVIFLMSMMLYVSFYDSLRLTSLTEEYRFTDIPVAASGHNKGTDVIPVGLNKDDQGEN